MKRFLKYSIALIGILFALYPALKNFNHIRNLHFNALTFLSALVVMLISYTFLPIIWILVGRAFGIPLKVGEAASSWYVSAMGRYIPGKVWQFVGRASILPYPASDVISAMFYEQIVLMVGASLFSLIKPNLLLFQISITLVLVVVLVLWKYAIYILRRWFPKLEHYPRRWDFVIIAIFITFLYWSVNSYSAYLISESIGGKLTYRDIAFAYSFATVVSYILPITPAGLGIREAVLSAVMGYDVYSSVFALLIRLAILVVDLIALGIGLVAGVIDSRTEGS